MNQLMSVAEVSALIRQGRCLSLAAPEAVLSSLPAGSWIGGTTPYFMTPDGVCTRGDGQVFVTDLSALGDVRIASFADHQVQDIVENAPANGFALTVVPAGSTMLQRFAAESTLHPDAFMKPTMGWIAGVHLQDLGRVQPKTFDGRGPTAYANKAVVAYVSLPPGKLASVEIVNIFEPDGADLLHFDETSFSPSHCRVNGERVAFYDYVLSKGADIMRSPLVGDFAGAHINASFQMIDTEARAVRLYAPVFEGVDYHVARPIPDYVQALRARLKGLDMHNAFLGCNCILNYLYGELEGQQIGGLVGPITFGEIGYQLLNQTVVVMRVH